MTKSPTDQAAKDLGKSLRDGEARGEERVVAPQEESLKHHGDDLQNALDKATETTSKPH